MLSCRRILLLVWSFISKFESNFSFWSILCFWWRWIMDPIHEVHLSCIPLLWEYFIALHNLCWSQLFPRTSILYFLIISSRLIKSFFWMLESSLLIISKRYLRFRICTPIWIQLYILMMILSTIFYHQVISILLSALKQLYYHFSFLTHF